MLLERKLKKIQKKRPSIPCFWKDTCMEIEAVEKIFQKKIKKNLNHLGLFWKDTCSGRSWQITGFRKEKSKKVRKNQTVSRFFRKILGEGKGVSTMAMTIFAKKVKKIPPMGRFLERYLFGDDRDFCWIVKKLKKVQNFSATLDFFWKILVWDNPGKIQASEKKNRKKSEKIRPLPDFRRRYLVGAIRWQL